MNSRNSIERFTIALAFSLLGQLVYGQVYVKNNLNAVVGDTVINGTYEGKLNIDGREKQYGFYLFNQLTYNADRALYSFLNFQKTSDLPRPSFNAARVAIQNQVVGKQGDFVNAIFNDITEVSDIANLSVETSGLVNNFNTYNATNGVKNTFTPNSGSPKPISATGVYNNYYHWLGDSPVNTRVIGLNNVFLINSTDSLICGVNNDMAFYPSSPGVAYGVKTLMRTYNNSQAQKGVKYGIYSEVDSAMNNLDSATVHKAIGYAGYFKGRVAVNGQMVLLSDEKLKENIIDIVSATDIIKQINPKQYDIISERQDVVRKKHFGFIAQDIEKIIPDLVTNVIEPGKSTIEEKKIKVTRLVSEKQANGKIVPVIKEVEEIKSEIHQGPQQDLKAVNYIEMIALLFQTVKEQQVVIEQLQKDVDILKKK